MDKPSLPRLRGGQIWQCRNQRKRLRVNGDGPTFTAGGWAFSNAESRDAEHGCYTVFRTRTSEDDLTLLLYDPNPEDDE